MRKDTAPMTYCIGNTHFDPVWLWTWDEALSSIRATFRSALDRMNEYSDYTYSFCTPATFEMIEKIDPALFEEIRERVRDGRWDLSEMVASARLLLGARRELCAAGAVRTEIS